MAGWGRLSLAVVTCAAALATAPSAAAGQGGLRAVLDGKPITLAEAGNLSCDDFAYPVLTCYETADEMLAAVNDDMALAAAGSGTDAGALAALSTGYVVVFENGAYAGAAFAISHDYSYLGTIGWNDKISSLKSYGASGRFYENAPPSGFIYYFGTSTWVSYVGDYYNDKFSAVTLN